MAIPSKPEKTNPCSNCGFPVKARRPASSGQHFCQEKACQAAKQRFYRTRGATPREQGRDDELVELVIALHRGNRTTCHRCGLEDAVVGWAHRDETGLGACFALGPRGKLVGRRFLDALHPERAPENFRATPEQRGIIIPPVGNA